MLSTVMAVRQNHALEHATIHVLTARNPSLRLVGRTTPSGFGIWGAVSTQELSSAAHEALARLQRGERALAVHPRCGTNLAVTAVLAGAASFAAGLGRARSRLERLPLALVAATAAAVAAQPLGLLAQERLTTSPDVAGVRISKITAGKLGSLVYHTVFLERG